MPQLEEPQLILGIAVALMASRQNASALQGAPAEFPSISSQGDSVKQETNLAVASFKGSQATTEMYKLQH